MLKIIHAKNRVLSYQKLFSDSINKKLNEQNSNYIGFPGGARWEEVSYSSSLKLWFTSSTDVDGTKRVWNAFGLQNPYEVRNLNIAVEINFPFTRKGDVNGVFLEDEGGNIYVGHRGLVNVGGRKSIRKIYSQYYGGVELCDDGSLQREIIIISLLNSKTLVKDIQVFVNHVYDIKELLRKGTDIITETTYGFTPEPAYRRSATISQIVEYTSEHSRIISQLKDILATSVHVENNQKIDLLTRDSAGRATHIFEAKTSSDTQSVYTAIGQLYFHALSFPVEPQKIFVAPDSISNKLRGVLGKLDISIVTYFLNEDSYSFQGLKEIGLGR